MAKLHGPFDFTGNLKGISAYKMRGCKDTVLRVSYGPSKKDMETKPAYDLTNRNIKDFGGCSTAGKWVRKAFLPLKQVSDYNMVGPIIALLKPIQEMDQQSEWGKRHVQLSLAPQLLEGFNFNRRSSFDSVVRNPVGYSLDKGSLSAVVDVPALLPLLTFFAPNGQAYYRVVATLGIVPDLYYHLPKYQPKGNYDSFFPATAQSEWYATKNGSPAQTLELHLPTVPENEAFSLVLSVGIQMGSAGALGNLEVVPYTGCGKIVAVR